MARGSFLQTSFLGGEWSPFSQGKSDEREYYRALNLSLNMLPTDEGALVRRSGTRFSAHAKVNTEDIRLIDFISESSDALVCELTAGIMRFHSRGTLLTEDPIEVSSISSATPAVVTTLVAHGYSADDTVVFLSPDTPFSVPVRNKQYLVKSPSGSTFNLNDLPPVGTGNTDGTELNGIFANVAIEVGKVVERTIPYLASELSELKYTEEEDTLYIFHKDHEIRTVERANLAVSELDFIDGPYLDQNETTTELSFSAVSGSITVTASAVTGINSGQGFLSTDVGRLIRVDTGTVTAPSWSWLEITAVASTTSVTATVRGPDLLATTGVTTWRLGLFSDTTGWPTHGVVHEGRLFLISEVFAGRIDGSRNFRFNDFTPTAQDGTVADDNGVSAIFAGAGRQNGKWLQSVGNGLLVGTDGGEYVVRASSFDDPISPFSIQVRRHTTYGSSDQLPVRAGRTSMFVQELGRSLFEYRHIGDGEYDGNDVSRQARHLTTDGITEIAYQKLPNPVVWCLRGDKRIIGCTFRDDLEGRQVAWHRHSVEYGEDVTLGEDTSDRYLQGGRSNSTASVHTITTAPFSDPQASRNDNLWMAVDREGTTCIEYLTPIFDISFAQNEGFFSDSGNIYFAGDKDINWEELSTMGDDTTVRFYGLDRLNGKSIDGNFRGFDIGTSEVINGYADFTFDSDLLTAEGAVNVIQSSQLTSTAVNFNSSHISDVHTITPSNIGVHSPQSNIIKGEDGIRYYILGGAGGVGAGGLTLNIHNADTGASAFVKTNTDVDTDASAAGVIAPSGDVGASANGGFAAMAIPDTPYIVVIQGRAAGTSSMKKVLYYRITSASTLVLDGGYAGRTDGLSAAQFSPQQAPGDAIYAQGHIMSNPSPGSNNSYAYRYPIAVAYHGEGRSTVLIVPSINFILANTPVGENITNSWVDTREFEISQSSVFGADILNLGDSPIAEDNRNRGFFLPRQSGRGSHFSMMFYLADLEAHDAGTESTTNPFLDANAAANITGLISSVRTRAIPQPAISDAMGLRRSVAVITVQRHSDFDVFPFPDEKENFSGVTGAAIDNYYCNPTVLPFDPNDESKPWLLFFPRIYRESGDRDKLGIRIYEWNPLTEKARFLSFSNGQVYTLGTDVDADVNPNTANVTWDRDTGQLTALITSNSPGEADVIVAEFGTFSPVLSTTTIVDERHIDAILGCNYFSRAQTLRPDIGVGAQNGPALGKLRRVDQYGLLTFKTGETYIGTNFVTAEMFEVEWENPAGNDAFGRTPLFSAVAHGSLQGQWDFDNMMAWEVRRPFPGAYIAIEGFSNASDR